MAAPADISDYHAHVYYDAGSKPEAELLRAAFEERFPQATFGRWHDRPVGPHPDWSYQIAFEPALFAEIVPALALARGSLVIFVHPNTGDDLADHRDYAIWMGAVRPLNLAMFEK
ncbi:MAG: DOPA 4,5-dioxygenase family protein [Alphaproteobacteria bacterium]|nr:DOPA 4,5-dioxygenase family protein [Alphaproteobacteria bacterium]